MKKLALLTALCSLSMAVHSADWTPVFKGWESGKETHILDNIWEETIIRSDETIGISVNGRSGNYESVPARYSADMSPARLVDDDVMTFTIPLKNATLYDLPIRSISYYVHPEIAVVGEYVTFYPMTNAQYQKLKRKKFASTGDDDICGDRGAEITKNDTGEVILINDGSC